MTGRLKTGLLATEAGLEAEGAIGSAGAPASPRISVRAALLLGCSLSVFAAAPANAQNQCGAPPPGGGTVTCPPGEYPTGIDYDVTADLTVVLQPGVVTRADSLIASDTQGVDLRVIGPVNTSLNSAESPSVQGTLHVISSRGTSAVDVDDVTSSGNFAPGINLFGVGLANATADTVTTSGSDSPGVFIDEDEFFANSLVGPSSGVTARVNSVTTSGDRSIGIDLFSGTGNIRITSGSVTTTGFRSEGIAAITIVGDMAVESGAIATTGDEARGIFARVAQFDPADPTGTINITSGSISTAGLDAEGILALNVTDVNVVSGTVITAGNGSSAGIKVGTDRGNIVVESNSVTTRGNITFGEAVPSGIVARSFSGTIGIASGAVRTDGGFAVGIDARTEQGDVEIVSGTIATLGSNAGAIYAETQTGGVTIDSGTATTAGEFSAAISARTGTNMVGDFDLIPARSVSITSDSITTTGPSSNGIIASTPNGNMTVDSGTISTSGAGSNAISVSGRGLVSIATDSIVTTGAESRGILTVASLNGAAIDIVSGSIDTTGAQSAAIAALVTGDGLVSVASQSIVTRGADSGAIEASSLFGGVAVDSGTISTLGANSIGIDASAPLSVTIASDAVTTAGAGSKGIAVASTAGPVSVDSGAVTTTGPNEARGIEILTENGAISVTSGTAATAGTDSDAIHAQVQLSPAGTGSITVTAGTTSTAGAASTAIHAWTPNGDVTVTSNAVTTMGDRGRGIFATGSNGNVVVTSGTVATSGATISEGIIAQSDLGNVTVTSGSVRIGGGTAPNTTNRGIVALSRGAGQVIVDSGSVETHGLNAPGINATSATGNVSVTSDLITTDGGSSPGIQAQAGFGADTGSVVIDSGSVTTTGSASRAIFASAAVDATVTSGSITTTGADSVGISAFATRGSLTIASGSITTSGTNADAIVANGDAIAITSTGTITTTGADSDGIAATAGTGPVTIDAGAVNVSGLGSRAIVSNSAASSGITIRGLVRSAQGFTVQADGGAAAVGILGTGTLRGRIDLTDAADTVTNAGTFDAIGTSLFGAGTDAFANSGTVRSVNGAAAFSGLESFANAGIIDMSDGAANDSLTLGAYNGGANARLIVDVDFTAGTSDLLVTAAATGTTAVTVNGGGATGGFDPVGIRVVDAAAGTSAGAFTLAGGSTSNGFVTSGLIFDAANFDFLLVNAPNQPVFETALFNEIMLGTWYDSADAVSAQLESGRTREAAGERGFGAWIQLHAGSRDRDASQSFAGTGFDVGYERDNEGLQAGLDTAVGTGGVAGLTFGLGRSDASFDASANRVETESVNLGAYFSWSSGGFFADILAKVDWIDAESDAGAGLQADFDATAYGLRALAGYRFSFGSAWLEPSVALSWVSVDTDDFTSAGADIEFDDLTSLRGSAGLRIGADIASGNGTFSPFAGIRAIEEFDGESENGFTFGSSLTLSEDAPGTWGEASAGFTYTSSRIEAFARGELEFGGFEGLSGRAGLRLRF